jgi:hypothetical protein
MLPASAAAGLPASAGGAISASPRRGTLAGSWRPNPLSASTATGGDDDGPHDAAGTGIEMARSRTVRTVRPSLAGYGAAATPRTGGGSGGAAAQLATYNTIHDAAGGGVAAQKVAFKPSHTSSSSRLLLAGVSPGVGSPGAATAGSITPAAAAALRAALQMQQRHERGVGSPGSLSPPPRTHAGPMASPERGAAQPRGSIAAPDSAARGHANAYGDQARRYRRDGGGAGAAARASLSPRTSFAGGLASATAEAAVAGRGRVGGMSVTSTSAAGGPAPPSWPQSPPPVSGPGAPANATASRSPLRGGRPW